MFSFWKKKELKNGSCTVNFQEKAIYVVGSHLHEIACDPLLVLEPHTRVDKLGEAVRDCVNSLKPESLSRVAGYDPAAKDSICFHVKIEDNGAAIRLYAIAGKGIEPRDAETMSCAKDVGGIGATLKSFYIKEKANKIPPVEENPVVTAPVPDSPVSFGYKCSWLAIKTNNRDAVCETLGLRNRKPSNWKDGVKAAYSKDIFVSPPVNGWTLVVGFALPEIGTETQPKLEEILRSTSRIHGETQYFGTHRVVEYHGWAKAIGGDLERVYAWVGERGETLANIGRQTAEEAALGIGTEEEEPPGEEDVMKLAAKWSINPCELGKMDVPSALGVVGSL